MDNQVAVKAVIQNKGERLEEGLRREANEETGITDLEVGKVIHVDEWFAKPEGELKHIVALFFLCKTKTDKVTLSEEHQEYAWVAASELDKI